MNAWIGMISDEQADENLLDALKLARTPHGTVDNVMRVHSHRPGLPCTMTAILFQSGCRRPFHPTSQFSTSATIHWRTTGLTQGI